MESAGLSQASNTGADDRFGFSVAVSGDTVVVGADQEDSNATGVGRQRRLFLRIDGVPGSTYRFQRAPNVTGAWGTIDTATAPLSGLIEYHDTSPLPSQAFYRTVQP